MKLVRIVLRDYRGVSELALEPALQGVTVVVGPNEIGKSSVSEALRLVLEFLDSSSHQDVRRIRPIGRDVGAQVEVELESGPYRFVYRKTWFKRPSTELRILAPRPEQLTGREAHERVLALLGETLDMPLFKALSIAQGRGQDRLALSDQTWVSRALDRAAGSASSGARELSLFERAREEFESYFTSKGKDGKALTAPREQMEALARERDPLAELLATLESDVADTSRLAEALRSDEEALARERAAKRALDARLLELEQSREHVERAEKDVAGARAAFELAREASSERRRLETEAAQARARLVELEVGARERAPALEQARERQSAAARTLEERRHQVSAARELVRVRAALETLVRDRADLSVLRERREKLSAAQAELVRQRSRLGEPPLDAKRVAALRKRHTELEVSAAKAAAAAPKLRLRARRELELSVDGEPRSMARDEQLELSGEAGRRIELPGALEVELAPGADSAAAARAHAARLSEWREELAALGVRDLADAEQRLAIEADARARIETLNATCAGLLHDLSPEQMDAKIERLSARVAAPVELNGDPASAPRSTNEAQQLRQEAETLAERAQQEHDAALTAARAADAHAVKLETEQLAVAQGLEQARAASERAEAALSAARNAQRDEQLVQQERDAEEKLRSLEALAVAAREAVEQMNPAALELQAANKHRVVADLEQRLAAHREQKARVDGRLESQGEEGLRERLETLERKLAVLGDESARTERRAQAAKLLYETLAAERLAERRDYVEPLARRIESLGRVVYGPSLRIALDDELAIESRTLDDVSVPFESLSTGAREQLGVLSRLACAQLVVEDGGAPLLLDDVLGHTDPERLERLAAVIALAAKQCQVILFTSNPERYRGIGGAKFIELGRETNAHGQPA